MKLVLVFLVCFVSLSYQQWFPFQQYYYAPRNYMPYFGLSSPYVQSGMSYIYGSEEQLNENEGVAVEGRAKPQNRFLWPSINLNSLIPTYTTTTTTSVTTTTSTVTTASVKSCITSTLFISGSTAACSRRRRDAEAADQLILADTISPSQVESETTYALDGERFTRSAELESSLSNSNEAEEQTSRQRQARGLFTLTVTSTSTATAYSFASTAVTKYYTLATSTSVLACLPSGYTVC